MYCIIIVDFCICEFEVITDNFQLLETSTLEGAPIQVASEIGGSMESWNKMMHDLEELFEVDSLPFRRTSEFEGSGESIESARDEAGLVVDEKKAKF